MRLIVSVFVFCGLAMSQPMPGPKGGSGGLTSLPYTLKASFQANNVNWPISYYSAAEFNNCSFNSGVIDSAHLRGFLQVAASQSCTFRYSTTTFVGNPKVVVTVRTAADTATAGSGSLAISYACVTNSGVYNPSFTALAAMTLASLATQPDMSTYQSTYTLTCAGSSTVPAVVYWKFSPTAPNQILDLDQITISHQ
jgi:hypothetical protein